MNEIPDNDSLPIGFFMNLAKNPDAMDNFFHMDKENRQTVIHKAESVQSKADMEALINRLGNSEKIF